MYHRNISPTYFVRYQLIIIDYHWFLLIIIDNHWLSLVIIGYHWLSLIIIDYHWLSLISLIIIDYLWLSKHLKKVNHSLTHWLTYNLKSRDASASKKRRRKTTICNVSLCTHYPTYDMCYHKNSAICVFLSHITLPTLIIKKPIFHQMEGFPVVSCWLLPP